MSEDEDGGRTSWVPFAIAGTFVAAILAAILLIDGSSDVQPEKAPSSPTTSATP